MAQVEYRVEHMSGCGPSSSLWAAERFRPRGVWWGGADAEACGHVEFDLAVREDVLSEQRCEAAPVLRSEQFGPVVSGEDVLSLPAGEAVRQASSCGS
jgi:hypothetical protein